VVHLPDRRTVDLPRVLHVPGADTDAIAGDRSYLVLAKPDVIANDIRLRGLALPEVTLLVGGATTRRLVESWPARLVGERTAGMVGSRMRCRRPSTVDQSC
jgi:hypothetical protein